MRIVGIGAGGHAKVLMDIARLMPGMQIVGMLDSRADRWGSDHYGARVLGDESMLEELRERIDAVFVGVGGVPSNAGRRRVFESVRAAGFRVVNLIHPRAVVAESVLMGEGVMVMGGSVVNPDAVLGDGVIVNTGAVVEHDCVIGDFAHVCPGTVLGGGVGVGEEAFIGIGSTVIQGARIGRRAVVAAGAVVVSDVADAVMVMGCPAKVTRRL